ncbi:MAG TPA: 6-phosphofructokinase [Candidatus Mcinerneyibacterium sp.]|nr:6-phosphofructokinase [Candidatus Mcinerneyibacterium sp.]
MKKNYRGTVAILTGGGDTCALNRSIEVIKNVAYLLDYKIYGIYEGWKGLLDDGYIVDISEQDINGTVGGSILGSSRTNPFKKEKNGENRIDELLNNVKKYDIDIIISIGGDDTNGVSQKLYKNYGIPVIGFPKTIDNDVKTKTIFTNKNGKEHEVSLCPGFPTAAQKIIKLISNLRTTAMTHNRIFVVEIMGRDAGWLPSAAAYGGADMVLIPELKMTKERIDDFLNKVVDKYQEKGDLIIGVSEGVRWWNKKNKKCDVVKENSILDEFGHPKLGGIASKIANILREKGIDNPRSQVAGYIPRSGFISEYDSQFATALGQQVLKMILNENFGYMPTLENVPYYREVEAYNTKIIPLSAIENYDLPCNFFYDVEKYNLNDNYIQFIEKMIPEKPFIPKRIDYKKIKPKNN